MRFCLYTGYRKHLDHLDNSLTSFETNWCKSIKLRIRNEQNFSLAPVFFLLLRCIILLLICLCVLLLLSLYPGNILTGILWGCCCPSLVGSEGQGQKVKVAVSMNIWLHRGKHPQLLYVYFKTPVLLHKLIGVTDAGLQGTVAALPGSARSTSITSLITWFLGFQVCSLALLVHCRSAPEMNLPPNKERKLPRPVSFNYRPTNLCEEQGKRQKEANRLMSSSALIKWTGWPDNPQEAESLTARGEEQISWLNNFLMCPSPAHKEGGPRPWLMHSEAWRKCLCDSPAELSPNEWSVFINLEPLSCQKERRVLERRGETRRASAYNKLIHLQARTCAPVPSPSPVWRRVYRKAV